MRGMLGARVLSRCAIPSLIAVDKIAKFGVNTRGIDRGDGPSFKGTPLAEISATVGSKQRHRWLRNCEISSTLSSLPRLPF